MILSFQESVGVLQRKFEEEEKLLIVILIFFC